MTKSTSSADDMHAQAVVWLVRTGDPVFADWEGLEAWLSASPAHADAYHAASADAADMVDLLATVAPLAVASAPVRPRWRPAPWLGGALAAALLLVVGYGIMRPAEPILYQTGPGEHRDVALSDGTRIALNGGTRLTVAANDPRAINLERGEALFMVHHDPARPFAVTVAGATIADVGTVFDVVRSNGATGVAVAQGTVLWNPSAEAVRLDAGKRLRSQDGATTFELAATDASAVGGWTRGQLSYDGTSLKLVADDLSRALGVPVVVAPEVAAQPVHGILHVDGSPELVLPRVAALLRLRADRQAHDWRLSAPP